MKTVTRDEAQRRFNELLEQVVQGGVPVTIEEDGRPVAIVTPVDVHERRQARRRFMDVVEEMQQRSNLSAEEAAELAREAVEAVREQTS